MVIVCPFIGLTDNRFKSPLKSIVIRVVCAILLTDRAQRRQGEKECVVIRPLVLMCFVRSFVQNRFVTVRVQLLDKLSVYVSVYLCVMFGEQFYK